MKLLLILTMFFVGCVTTDIKPTTPKQPDIVSPETPPQVVDSTPDSPAADFGSVAPLAFEGTKYWSESWDKALKGEIAKYDWSGVQNLCKQLKIEDCVAQLISKMTQYESSFNPSVKYEEGGDLKGVTSRGLLQISIVSSKSYGCGFVNEQEIHNPEKNLQCGVKIVHRWAKEYKILIGKDKYSGCGRYWSVCRPTSGSYKKIKDYMEMF